MNARSSPKSTGTALERLKLVERSLQSNMAESITADYLVIGAGAMAMAFVDTLLSETTDKKIIMLDRRARPGGHWVTAYSFVRLHQPAAFYGVNSRPLDSGHIDEVGWNKGLVELSSRDAVVAYFDLVMRQTFLPSGRVEFFPKHEYLGEGEFQSLLTKKSYKVGPETTIVDATYSRTSVPSMRPPPYEVSKGVDLVTPNDLPDISRGYANYTIVGAGKTAIDTCLWLLENDIKESKITWIMPRDSFFIERDSLQPASRFPEKAQARIEATMESTMAATSAEHYLQLQLEKKILCRLDENVWPTMYHCATVSLLELEAMRNISTIVRKGRVTKITPEEVFLEKGTYIPDPDTLYIDCSASAIAKMSPIPIFQNKTITLQPVRFCQQTFSAALIAHVEAAYSDVEFKNTLCKPVPMPNEPVDNLLTSLQSNINQLRWGREAKMRKWLAGSRLDFFGNIFPQPPPEKAAEVAKQMRQEMVAMSRKLWSLLDGMQEPERTRVMGQLEGFTLEGL
ncbi:hypothetical protein AC579_2975 [Pseudocercospora musae]|uniref:FAD/NAD(P)-binding domain-containing protein n=1 Tax=Pseudocercospora musae TaxID=113226 RepID=A0A139I7S3_9PEZI|nr:hypothetical protein AC579_2975 [Pseudocercospora musae]